MQEFKGRVAVVTGAASGMGLAMARRFASEGMMVALADLNGAEAETQAAAIRAAGGLAVGRQLDVAQFDAVERLAESVFGEFGGVHILCNNAGVAAPGGRTWEHDLHTWHWLMGVNLWGVIHGIRAFVPRMLAGGDEGHVVNTASMAGLINGQGGGAPYSASKHAVVSVSESLYRELKMAGAKVSASVLCPGYVATSIRANSERDRPRQVAEPADAAGALPRTRGLADMPGVFAPEYIADQVFEAIREDQFYILATQDEFIEWMHMRHRRLEERRNPAVPSRSVRPQ